MRARLFVLGGRDAGRSIEVEGEVLVGRDATCGLRLRGRSISRRHARFAWDGEAWHVQDLGSRNGVRLRGERVERAPLTDLDEVLLGEVPVRFRTDALDEPDEIVLEGGERLEEPEPAPAPREELRAVRVHDVERADGAPRPRPSGVDGHAGLWRGDLAQQPVWLRALLALLLVALAGGVFVAAFLAVQSLRRSL